MPVGQLPAFDILSRRVAQNGGAAGQPGSAPVNKSHTVFRAASSWASLGGDRTGAPGDDPLPPLGLLAPPGAAAASELAPLLLLLVAAAAPFVAVCCACAARAAASPCWVQKLVPQAAQDHVRPLQTRNHRLTQSCGKTEATQSVVSLQQLCHATLHSDTAAYHDTALLHRAPTCGRKKMSPPPEPADTARPKRRTEPRPAVHSPATARSVDVLPAPEGPTTSSDCPARTWCASQCCHVRQVAAAFPRSSAVMLHALVDINTGTQWADKQDSLPSDCKLPAHLGSGRGWRYRLGCAASRLPTPAARLRRCC